MENCVVTKLKAVVINDDLPIFGKARVFVKNTTNTNRSIRIQPNAEVEVIGGTVGGQTTLNSDGSGYILLNNEVPIVSDGTFEDGLVELLIPKYDIKNMYADKVNTEDLLCSRESLGLLMVGSFVKARYLKDVYTFTNITSIDLRNVVVDEPFDVSEIGNNGAITSFIALNFGNCYGNLDKLGMSPLSAPLYVPRTKNVSFEVVNFVHYNRTAGRTTGSITATWLGACNATFNGTVIRNQETNSISWTASTITCNEVTIDA